MPARPPIRSRHIVTESDSRTLAVPEPQPAVSRNAICVRRQLDLCRKSFSNNKFGELGCGPWCHRKTNSSASPQTRLSRRLLCKRPYCRLWRVPNAPQAHPQEPLASPHILPTASVELPVSSQTERPWLSHYPPCVPKTLKYPAIPAWGLLAHSACEFPERVASVHLNRNTTYAELAEQARRTASMLHRLGVRPGDRVGVLLPNVPEFLSTVNGIWMAGAAVVAISPLSCGEEVSELVKATGCRVAVALDVLAPLLWEGAAQPEVVVLTTLQDRLPLWQRPLYQFARQRRFLRAGKRQSKYVWFANELARSQPDYVPVAPPTLDEPAFLLATGGTTGRPKAVVLSHRNLVANATQIHAWAGTTMGHDTVLAVVPFFHSYGLSSCALAGVSMAATIIMHHRFIPKTVLELIKRYKPTVMPAVPAMLASLNTLLRTRSVKFRRATALHFRGSAARPANRGRICFPHRRHGCRGVWTF